MKKLIIGAIVGGILIFLWQTLSWTALNLHASESGRIDSQDTIINFLNNYIKEDGQYVIPRVDDKVSNEEMERQMKEYQGKPWALVSYHKTNDGDMVTSAIKGLLACIISALFICYILSTNPNRSFGGIVISTILIGIVGYLFIPYAEHNWYSKPGAVIGFIDVLVSFGLCGIWLGWWLKKK